VKRLPQAAGLRKIVTAKEADNFLSRVLLPSESRGPRPWCSAPRVLLDAIPDNPELFVCNDRRHFMDRFDPLVTFEAVMAQEDTNA
jgi:hypothetical protein